MEVEPLIPEADLLGELHAEEKSLFSSSLDEDSKTSKEAEEPVPSLHPVTSANEDAMCRVCHCEATDEEPLYCPCLCKGSIKYIHESCLLQWMKAKSISKCELCGHKIQFSPVLADGAPSSLSKMVALRLVIGSLATRFLRLGFKLLIQFVVYFLIMPIFCAKFWRVLFHDSFWDVLHLYPDYQDLLLDLSGGLILFGFMFIAVIFQITLEELFRQVAVEGDGLDEALAAADEALAAVNGGVPAEAAPPVAPQPVVENGLADEEVDGDEEPVDQGLVEPDGVNAAIQAGEENVEGEVLLPNGFHQPPAPGLNPLAAIPPVADAANPANADGGEPVDVNAAGEVAAPEAIPAADEQEAENLPLWQSCLSWIITGAVASIYIIFSVVADAFTLFVLLIRYILLPRTVAYGMSLIGLFDPTMSHRMFLFYHQLLTILLPHAVGTDASLECFHFWDIMTSSLEELGLDSASIEHLGRLHDFYQFEGITALAAGYSGIAALYILYYWFVSFSGEEGVRWGSMRVKNEFVPALKYAMIGVVTFLINPLLCGASLHQLLLFVHDETSSPVAALQFSVFSWYWWRLLYFVFIGYFVVLPISYAVDSIRTVVKKEVWSRYIVDPDNFHQVIQRTSLWHCFTASIRSVFMMGFLMFLLYHLPVVIIRKLFPSFFPIEWFTAEGSFVTGLELLWGNVMIKVFPAFLDIDHLGFCSRTGFVFLSKKFGLGYILIEEDNNNRPAAAAAAAVAPVPADNEPAPEEVEDDVVIDDEGMEALEGGEDNLFGDRVEEMINLDRMREAVDVEEEEEEVKEVDEGEEEDLVVEEANPEPRQVEAGATAPHQFLMLRSLGLTISVVAVHVVTVGLVFTAPLLVGRFVCHAVVEYVDPSYPHAGDIICLPVGAALLCAVVFLVTASWSLVKRNVLEWNVNVAEPLRRYIHRAISTFIFGLQCILVVLLWSTFYELAVLLPLHRSSYESSHVFLFSKPMQGLLPLTVWEIVIVNGFAGDLAIRHHMEELLLNGLHNGMFANILAPMMKHLLVVLCVPYVVVVGVLPRVVSLFSGDDEWWALTTHNFIYRHAFWVSTLLYFSPYLIQEASRRLSDLSTYLFEERYVVGRRLRNMNKDEPVIVATPPLGPLPPSLPNHENDPVDLPLLSIAEDMKEEELDDISFSGSHKTVHDNVQLVEETEEVEKKEEEKEEKEEMKQWGDDDAESGDGSDTEEVCSPTPHSFDFSSRTNGDEQTLVEF